MLNNRSGEPIHHQKLQLPSGSNSQQQYLQVQQTEKRYYQFASPVITDRSAQPNRIPHLYPQRIGLSDCMLESNRSSQQLFMGGVDECLGEDESIDESSVGDRYCFDTRTKENPLLLSKGSVQRESFNSGSNNRSQEGTQNSYPPLIAGGQTMVGNTNASAEMIVELSQQTKTNTTNGPKQQSAAHFNAINSKNVQLKNNSFMGKSLTDEDGLVGGLEHQQNKGSQLSSAHRIQSRDQRINSGFNSGQQLQNSYKGAGHALSIKNNEPAAGHAMGSASAFSAHVVPPNDSSQTSAGASFGENGINNINFKHQGELEKINEESYSELEYSNKDHLSKREQEDDNQIQKQFISGGDFPVHSQSGIKSANQLPIDNAGNAPNEADEINNSPFRLVNHANGQSSKGSIELIRQDTPGFHSSNQHLLHPQRQLRHGSSQHQSPMRLGSNQANSNHDLVSFKCGSQQHAILNPSNQNSRIALSNSNSNPNSSSNQNNSSSNSAGRLLNNMKSISDQNIKSNHDFLMQSFANPEGKNQDHQIIFLNEAELLAGKRLVYTALPMTEQTAFLNQTMFPKLTKRKYTLVMEIVDILVRLIDATTDRFHLQDVGICQFSVKNRNADNALEIILLKYMISPMLSSLRDLQQYCELIAFTFLPRQFVDSILLKVPDLRNIFSYIFCREEMVQTEEFLIKDLSYLLLNRNPNDIIVIDVDESRIDDEFFSSIILQHRYDGSINYNQIHLVKQTIRQVSSRESSNHSMQDDGGEPVEQNKDTDMGILTQGSNHANTIVGNAHPTAASGGITAMSGGHQPQLFQRGPLDGQDADTNWMPGNQ